MLYANQASLRFVSFGKIRLWSLDGRHRGIVIVICEKWAVIQTVSCKSGSYGGEEIECVTAVFGGE